MLWLGIFLISAVVKAGQFEGWECFASLGQPFLIRVENDQVACLTSLSAPNTCLNLCDGNNVLIDQVPSLAQRSSLTCGPEHLQLYGTDGYTAGHWCYVGKSLLVAPASHQGCYEDNPQPYTSCLPILGMNTGADVQKCSLVCANYSYFGVRQGRCYCSPFLAGTLSNASLCSPCPSGVGMCGGTKYNSIYKQVWSPLRRDTTLVPPYPYLGWRCFYELGQPYLIRIEAGNGVACFGSSSCSTSFCDGNTIISVPTTTSSVQCTETQLNTAGHWCNKGRTLLKSYYKVSGTYTGWRCFSQLGQTFGIRSAGSDVACLTSTTAPTSCLSICNGNTVQVSQIPPTNQQATLTCGSQHLQLYGTDGYTPGHWCYNGRELLAQEQAAIANLRLPKKGFLRWEAAPKYSMGNGFLVDTTSFYPSFIRYNPATQKIEIADSIGSWSSCLTYVNSAVTKTACDSASQWLFLYTYQTNQVMIQLSPTGAVTTPKCLYKGTSELTVGTCTPVGRFFIFETSPVANAVFRNDDDNTCMGGSGILDSVVVGLPCTDPAIYIFTWDEDQWHNPSILRLQRLGGANTVFSTFPLCLHSAESGNNPLTLKKCTEAIRWERYDPEVLEFNFEGRLSPVLTTANKCIRRESGSYKVMTCESVEWDEELFYRHLG